MWGGLLKSVLLTLLSMAALTAPLIMRVNTYPLSKLDYLAILLLTVWLFNEFYLPSTPRSNEIKERLSLQILVILQPGTIFITAAQYFWLGPTLTLLSTMRFFGLLMALSGLILRALSMVTLGKRYTMVVSIREGHTIVTRGLYKHIRHPGYLGMFLFLLGFVLFFSSSWGLIVYMIWGIGQLYRIRIEERVLENFFGNFYTEYQKRSKRLIPFVY
ncbi:MAG: hypothetical protein A3F16_05495 [Deltaproteobacteria bacterium RIFCSPHIGHO2_12_FULL_43_9]|nr:MAG: hypothetical protein A3F16_05495 [Deltaproteobacteria bacterium RIFCSPHIGHO2_12_FULL_43_9]